MLTFVEKVTRLLGKKRMKTVSSVEESSSGYEICLKDGWINSEDDTLHWYFDEDNLVSDPYLPHPGSAEKQMFDDLMYWFDNVVSYQEYLEQHGYSPYARIQCGDWSLAHTMREEEIL